MADDDVPDWAKHESEREHPAPVGPSVPRKQMDPYVRLFWVIFLAVLAANVVTCLGWLIFSAALSETTLYRS